MMTLGEMMGGGIPRYIWFNETSRKGGVMGMFNGISVFPQEGYYEYIEHGKTYLCQLTEHTGRSHHYTAIPIHELTKDNLPELGREVMESLVEHIYRMDPTHFDSLITEKTLRDAQDKAIRAAKEKMVVLKRENERLKKELEASTASSPAGTIPMKTEDVYEDEHLEDRYYSVRVNLAGDMVMLVKDDGGTIDGHGHSVDLAPIKKILGTENVHGEYCQKYGGVVFTKA